MNERLEHLKNKYSRSKWSQYSSFYIKKDRHNSYYISEREYATYDRPDWSSHELLTLEEASWMDENSDVKFWDRNVGKEKLEPNPKQLRGDKKPPLAQFPLSAQIYASLAHYDGDLKYGYRNWQESPVEARTYINAAMRHLRLYENGENNARDTNVPNLGAVIACCAILIDAELYGSLIDNREKNPAACDALHEMEKIISSLKEKAKERQIDD